MRIITEIEFDDVLYTVDATVTDGEASTYDYAGSAPELEVWTICNEIGCEVTSNISYTMYDFIEDRLLEIYRHRSE